MLTRFDPFRDIGGLRREIERIFDPLPLRNDYDLAETGSVPLDIFEEGSDIVVKASIPGFKPEEIKVDVRGDVLHIIGESKKDESKKERNYHMKEHRYARLERSVVLPTEVNVDKAEATFKNGILTLTMPRSEKTMAHVIPIKS